MKSFHCKECSKTYACTCKFTLVWRNFLWETYWILSGAYLAEAFMDEIWTCTCRCKPFLKLPVLDDNKLYSSDLLSLLNCHIHFTFLQNVLLVNLCFHVKKLFMKAMCFRSFYKIGRNVWEASRNCLGYTRANKFWEKSHKMCWEE